MLRNDKFHGIHALSRPLGITHMSASLLTQTNPEKMKPLWTHLGANYAITVCQSIKMGSILRAWLLPGGWPEAGHLYCVCIADDGSDFLWFFGDRGLLIAAIYLFLPMSICIDIAHFMTEYCLSSLVKITINTSHWRLALAMGE